MTARTRRAVAVASAVVGFASFWLWFGRYWPASSWLVLPRAQMQARVREVAQNFGLKTDNAKATLVASVSKPLARYAQEHPTDEAAHTVSPLTARFKFSVGDQTSEAGIDSRGLPVYWKADSDFKSSKKYASDDEAANAAFSFMAGAQAAAFSDPLKSNGDERDERQFVWKKPVPAHSNARERITIVTKNGVVESAERRVYISSEGDEDDSDSADSQGYWGVLAGIFWTICLPALIAIFSLYLLWSMRKAVNHGFPLRMAGLSALVIGLALAVGANATKDSSWGELWAALEILVFVGVGRGISTSARPKWFCLEQLCGLAPFSKSMGRALLAGVVFSPLLAALPFLVVGCGLFPRSYVAAQNLETLLSPAPPLDSGNLSVSLGLLGFFGFGVPWWERVIRTCWLRWPIAVALGTVYFAYEIHAVSGPIAGAVTTGFCILALYWFVYAQFDLLAVLTLQLSSGAVLSIFMLGQKHLGIWPLVLSLGAVVAVGFWLRKTARSVSEGDPLATNPALSGFRAEREKLQAEFSIARRAQEGMLPHAPPDIPGYSIAASCTPSLDVGGDLFDFLKLPDGRIGIGVADVSGKGVPAALYMTLTKGLLASVSKDNAELIAVVEEVNRHLYSVTRKKVFVTLALGFLNADKRVMQCVRAGHNPVVWRRTARNVTTLVAPSGLGLGITASRVFSLQLKMVEMSLEEGDAVVFYSDGITEAMNSRLEQFGEQRLMEAVERTDHLDAAAARDSILSTVRTFLGGVHPQDDMTLVVLRVGK